MVAEDDTMKPTKVPQFDPEGDEEQRLYSLAKKAREGMRMDDK